VDQYIGKFLDNRYELLEVIGSGGMAQVYRARCHRLNRLVAVKILRSDLAKDADFRRRFHDESQAIAMLSHPNITSVYDVSRTGDIEYIVMELIDGITLKQYMKRKGILNWRESLHFITQIMSGLSHAHSRGIIHRDIKPQNIMVLRDGSVKVTDFGIARLNSSAQSTLTQEALGSVHYISPEQAKGSRVDARSDIYSAGVVLYEMTTGRLPFEGDSAVSVAIQHINSMPLSPRELNPEIPEGLEKIILKAMAPLPDDRYSSADQMLVDLEKFRKNPNVNFAYHQEPLDLLGNEPTRKIDLPPEEELEHYTGGYKRNYAESFENSYARNYDRGYEESHRNESAESRSGTNLHRGKSKKKKREKNGFLIAAIVAIALFVIGIGYFLWVFFLSGLLAPGNELVVPTLLGKTLEEVQESEEYRQFKIVLGGEVENDKYEPGEIADQDPEPGRTAKENDTITVYIVADGNDPDEGKIPVEDVVDKEAEDAIRILEEQGFKVKEEEEASDTVPKGCVISTSPKAGTLASEGDTITVYISTGQKQVVVTVPQFVGMTEQAAVRAIEKAGLEVGSIKEVENDAEEGLVVWQSIPFGTEVGEGITINLQISKGSSRPSTAPSNEVPSTEPTSVQPTASAQQPVSKTFSVQLPEGDGNVHVQILVNGEVGYDQMVDRTNLKSIQPTLTGIGVCSIEVYFDGVLSATTTVDFNG
jgi:serine/threonine protein kinase/beta-lactam-binding protein with PASTA domain